MDAPMDDGTRKAPGRLAPGDVVDAVIRCFVEDEGARGVRAAFYDADGTRGAVLLKRGWIREGAADGVSGYAPPRAEAAADAGPPVPESGVPAAGPSRVAAVLGGPQGMGGHDPRGRQAPPRYGGRRGRTRGAGGDGA